MKKILAFLALALFASPAFALDPVFGIAGLGFMPPATIADVPCGEGYYVVNYTDFSQQIETGCNEDDPFDFTNRVLTPVFPQTSVTGNAGTATKWATGRTLSITGDISYTSPSLDGSANVTAAGTLATVNSNVGTFGSGSTVPVITVDSKGRITAVSTAAIPVGVNTFNYPSRALNSCFQISNSQDADFHYKVDVSSSLSLTSGATGTVTATSYSTSSCTTGSQVIADGQSGQSGTLVVGLGINQVQSVPLDGTLPAGKWIKITTANTAGAPTFAIRAAQSEVLKP